MLETISHEALDPSHSSHSSDCTTVTTLYQGHHVITELGQVCHGSHPIILSEYKLSCRSSERMRMRVDEQSPILINTTDRAHRVVIQSPNLQVQPSEVSSVLVLPSTKTTVILLLGRFSF